MEACWNTFSGEHYTESSLAPLVSLYYIYSFLFFIYSEIKYTNLEFYKNMLKCAAICSIPDKGNSPSHTEPVTVIRRDKTKSFSDWLEMLARWPGTPEKCDDPEATSAALQEIPSLATYSYALPFGQIIVAAHGKADSKYIAHTVIKELVFLTAIYPLLSSL